MEIEEIDAYLKEGARARRARSMSRIPSRHTGI